ncbi:hypothetical protein ACLB2K_013542 [Fragaria x ananassa]
MGAVATDKFLMESLIFISIGSNEIFGYNHSKSSIPKENFLCSYEPLEGDTLDYLYVKHNAVLLLKWQTLYNLGARKFGIISVAPIGCCPSQRIFNATGGCLEELNEYPKLGALLCKLSTEYEGFVFP